MSLTDRIRRENLIQLAVYAGEAPFVFRKIDGWDLAAVNLMPGGLLAKKSMNEEQATQAVTKHLDDLFSDSKTLNTIESMMRGLLTRCSVNPKIVLEGQVTNPQEQISYDELGDLKLKLFADLANASGISMEGLKDFAPFRDWAGRVSPGPAGQEIQSAPQPDSGQVSTQPDGGPGSGGPSTAEGEQGQG